MVSSEQKYLGYSFLATTSISSKPCKDHHFANTLCLVLCLVSF